MNLSPSVQRTKCFEEARQRLSKFVLREALHICRVTGLSYEESDNAPSTYEEVLLEFNEALRLKRPVRVYKGASDTCIYSDKSINWAFRFWHDYLHYSRKLDFSYNSEILVGRIQCARVANDFGLGSIEHLLMESDTIGQVEYFKKHGSFVENQVDFARHYIQQSNNIVTV